MVTRSVGSARRLLTALVLLAVAAPEGLAQDKYPTRPIRIIVPTATGGATDIGARLIAQDLSKRWGQPVVVENRAGAGTIIGSDIVAKRPLTVEQVPRALARGCDPAAGCKRRTWNRSRMRAYAVASP
jgi:tripartite-type tricarboxylate transporter receptor subunit TctC